MLLGFLPEEERNEIIDRLTFERMTAKTPSNREMLLEHLEEVRQNGYAISQEERIEGGAGVAAPVFDRNGLVMAAVTVNVPSVRFSFQRATVLAVAVKKAAADLSKYLGYPQTISPGVSRFAVRGESLAADSQVAE